jgi:predicted DNA-binding protein (MmcQ/YjbR family)
VAPEALNVAALKRHCSRFPGAAAVLLPEPMNVLSYRVDGRTFAYFKTSAPERWRFSVRVTPERFLELTDMPGVKPARWMGRWRWVTIVDVARFPADYLHELVDWSYRDAVSRLSKRRQRELLGPI